MKWPAISRWLSGRLAKGALAATLWQGLRVGSQALWMIVIARALGPSGYGAFAGAAGLATALGSLTGLGFGLVMLQDASRDPAAFAGGWKRAVAVCVASGALLWLAFLFSAPFVIPLPVWQLAAIGIPEVICFPLTIVSSYAFQTRERMGWAGAMYSLVPGSNLCAAVCFFSFAEEHTLATYLPWHAGSSVVAALLGHAMVTRLLRPGPAPLSMMRRDASEAFGFSLMRVIDNGLGSLDKTLVLRLAGTETAGIYTAAYRLVTVLSLPVTSLSMAALPRLFRAGHGEDENPRFVRHLVTYAGAGGVAALIGVLVLSKVIPWLLGGAFAASATFARWLCLFPLFFGLSSLGCNILIASNLRRYRIWVQLLGLFALTGGMIVLVPAFGLAGAAVALLTAHGVIVLTIWGVVRHTGAQKKA
jgi:O-antigen/teichoic acid export membrane protein